MQMTSEEIVLDYNAAANKARQINNQELIMSEQIHNQTDGGDAKSK